MSAAARPGFSGDVQAVRSFLAPNPGPFTFDGTRSYVVGGEAAAVIDPGPADPDHLLALSGAVEDAARVVVLLTHAHQDHAEGAEELARRTGATVAGAGPDIRDGQAFDTSAGPLFALFTPGHARSHFCFHLPSRRAVFTGDLILGTGDTTWTGAYPGGVADYLTSLDRVGSLGAQTFYPGHGDPITDTEDAVARFRNHRLARIEQVRQAIADGVPRDSRALAAVIYGALPATVFDMAVRGLDGILDYLSAARSAR